MAGGRQGWGWHQLDPAWAERLVTDAGITAGALVLDVGAGTGAISAPLLAAGARVVAVELHPQRARLLRQRFGRSIVVVEADAGDLRLPRQPFHVVANPPFNVTAPLLRRLLQPGSRLVTAHLIVQSQVARRWTAGSAPGAKRWRQDFNARMGPRLPRSAFHPVPRVDGTVLVLERHPPRNGRQRPPRR